MHHIFDTVPTWMNVALAIISLGASIAFQLLFLTFNAWPVLTLIAKLFKTGASDQPDTKLRTAGGGALLSSFCLALVLWLLSLIFNPRRPITAIQFNTSLGNTTTVPDFQICDTFASLSDDRTACNGFFSGANSTTFGGINGVANLKVPYSEGFWEFVSDITPIYNFAIVGYPMAIAATALAGVLIIGLLVAFVFWIAKKVGDRRAQKKAEKDFQLA